MDRADKLREAERLLNQAADLMDEWNACTYLATDNALFAALKAQAVTITGMTEAQVEAVLKECVY